MKNNRKNRRLKYIRTKNTIRSRKYIYAICFKIKRSIFINDPSFVECYIDMKVNNLLKKYRIKERPRLKVDYFEHDGDNILHNLVTVRIEFN